jgi:hypothetical protein
MLLIREEANPTNTSPNPLGSYLDAKERDRAARATLKDLLDTDEHVDRVVAVGAIIKRFFDRYPSYHTARPNRGKPFEGVKIADVGAMLSRKPTEVKQAELYGPLEALGNVDVISKNGHLMVRVYA